MKGFIAFLFVLTAPIAVFLTSILYAPNVTTVLKTELGQQGVYTQMQNQLLSMQSEDPQTQVMNEYIQKKFTADYIQSKAETTIDNSSVWITGVTTTPPVLSFKDIKDELVAQNPELLSSIQELAKQAAQDQQSTADAATQQQASQGIDQLNKIVQSDWVIKLDTYLAGLKNFYSFLRIMQPLTVGLSILYLVLLAVFNHSWSSRCKWIGITLIISGLLGFGLVYLDTFLINSLVTIVSGNTNQAIKIVSPIVFAVIKHFVNVYVQYQRTTGIAFFIAAVVCLIISVIAKPKVAAAPLSKPTKKNK